MGRRRKEIQEQPESGKLSQFFYERKCYVCGKIFCTRFPAQWAFRGPRDRMYCSWSCLRKDEQRLELLKRNKTLKKMELRADPVYVRNVLYKCLVRGMSNDEISERTGLSPESVDYYRQRWETSPQHLAKLRREQVI